jgi:hypothetical protein
VATPGDSRWRARAWLRPPQRMHLADTTTGSVPMRTPDLSAMLRWPNVPACYGWLSLDRRGRWRPARRERSPIAGLRALPRPPVRACDQERQPLRPERPAARLCRPRVHPLGAAPGATGELETHVGTPVEKIRGAAIDEEGNLLLETADGIALVCDRDLPALHGCLLLANGMPADDASVLAAMHSVDGEGSPLTLSWRGARVPVRSLRRADVARRHGFVASPQPAAAEERH